MRNNINASNMEFEALRSKLKNARDASLVIKNCMIEAEREKDKTVRAHNFLEIASVGYLIVPIHVVLDNVRIAIRTFPRVKMGIDALINICSTSCAQELRDADGPDYHIPRRYLFFAVAYLVLCNYDYRRIKEMLHKKTKLSRDEKKIISYTKFLCHKLDSLYFSSNDKKARNELYVSLTFRINKRIAAALTLYLYKSVPPQYLKEYYGMRILDLPKEESEINNESLIKDYLGQIKSLTTQNELLQSQVAELQKENEELLEKAKVHVSNTIPDSLKSALLN